MMLCVVEKYLEKWQMWHISALVTSFSVSQAEIFVYCVTAEVNRTNSTNWTESKGKRDVVL